MKRYAVEKRFGRYYVGVIADFDTKAEAEEYRKNRDPYGVGRFRVRDVLKKPSKIKRTETPRRYAALSEPAVKLGEKNDCTVRTLAILGEVPYERAHAMLAARGGGRRAAGPLRPTSTSACASWASGSSTCQRGRSSTGTPEPTGTSEA